MQKKELPKAYEPAAHEERIYKKWEESGGFNPDNLDVAENAKSFTIMMPPPNVTGVLHVGHSSMLTYQDVMIRYHRMLGERVLWLPGTDHASIATQNRVEKNIFESEGKTRHDIGREELLKRINIFVEQTRSTILSQIKKMGASCDWSRLRYTMDSGLSSSVKELFVRMYNDGLIYRGDRVVNWCTRCQSTLADDEVKHVARNSKIYTFKYNKEFPIAITSSRPETKLADVAVAVHPSDERYANLIGSTHTVEFAGNVKLNLKIVSDYHVDKDFGTGALGVTPAHSLVDYQIAIANDLPVVKLIDENGFITKNGGDYEGLSVEQAREAVVNWLKREGLLIDEQDSSQNLSVCYRCMNSIEPLPSLQWFVDVDKKITFKDGVIESLKERSIRVVDEGQIKFIPERFENVYKKWMSDLHDWCISRQIWFGHRIPAWYKDGEVYVGLEKPGGEGWIEDMDTLDTWFSSGQWTFATLNKNGDLKKFHPTSVLETGYDIIFFWVARMILMTEYYLGEVPFRNVYIHGLVRDEHGVKMSKSLGNVLNPLDVIPIYGTDALRMSLIVGSTPGNDLKISNKKIEGFRNFANKLYNITRYVLSIEDEVVANNTLTLADEWILNELNKTIIDVTSKLDQYQFSAAAESLKDFTWNYFADWYIEISKIEGGKKAILTRVLNDILKLWHPFMPFITEYLWELCENKGLLMLERWPKLEDIKVVKFDPIIKLIEAIRMVRGENKIDPVLFVNAVLVTKDINSFTDQKDSIRRLARLEEISFYEKPIPKPSKSATYVFDNGDVVYVLLDGLVDFEKEKKRLEKEIIQTENNISSAKDMLANENFVSNAKHEVVERMKDSLILNTEKLLKLKKQLEDY